MFEPDFGAVGFWPMAAMRPCPLARCFIAARQAVPGRGSDCGGRRCAPTPLRCSARGRVAELTAFAALSAFGQLRRVSLRSALRAPTPGLCFSSPQKSPPPGTARRAAALVSLANEQRKRLRPRAAGNRLPQVKEEAAAVRPAPGTRRQPVARRPRPRACLGSLQHPIRRAATGREPSFPPRDDHAK